VARLRLTAASESSARRRGDAVGLIKVSLSIVTLHVNVKLFVVNGQLVPDNYRVSPSRPSCATRINMM